LGASARVLAAKPAAAAPTKVRSEPPELLTAAEMFAEEALVPKSVEETRVLLEQDRVDHMGRQRSYSSPIWKKVKAGWHLPKVLRLRSWEKLGG